MKINIANQGTGQQKVFEIGDENKLIPFYEERMGAVVPGDTLGDEFKGYLFKITGGNDKQGFPMMQGILRSQRVRLLFKDGMPCYRIRRKGMRKRKSIRGCIVAPDLAILNLTIEKEGDAPIEGLTEGVLTNRKGPKRASKIRKMFGLEKADDVRKFVVARKIEKEGKPTNVKRPKIQRLVTPVAVQRKRRYKNNMKKKVKASLEARKAYVKTIHDYKAALKEKHAAAVAKKKKKTQDAKTEAKSA